MLIDTFAERLGDIEIFRGLAPERLAAIARIAERIVFRPGQTIISAGRPGDGAFLLVDGRAIVLADGADVPETSVVPGSLVGEIAMLIEHEHRITVAAEGSVRALKLSRSALHQLMARDPALAEHFVGRISSRLSRMAIEMRRIDGTLALATDAQPAPL